MNLSWGVFSVPGVIHCFLHLKNTLNNQHYNESRHLLSWHCDVTERRNVPGLAFQILSRPTDILYCTDWDLFLSFTCMLSNCVCFVIMERGQRKNTSWPIPTYLGLTRIQFRKVFAFPSHLILFLRSAHFVNSVHVFFSIPASKPMPTTKMEQWLQNGPFQWNTWPHSDFLYLLLLALKKIHSVFLHISNCVSIHSWRLSPTWKKLWEQLDPALTTI